MPKTIIRNRRGVASPFVPSQNLEGISTVQLPATLIKNSQANRSGRGSLSGIPKIKAITTVIAPATSVLKSNAPNRSVTRSRGVRNTSAGNDFS